MPLLPTWHNITKKEVANLSLFLADKLARNTAMHTIEDIAKEIISQNNISLYKEECKMIDKIVVQNYKIFELLKLSLNNQFNIFVGDNDSGKSTMLEVLSIITSGKLNGYPLDRQLKASLFSKRIRDEYIEKIKKGNPIESLPSIKIEAYMKNEEKYADYKGTNNSLGLNCPGISLNISFNKEYSPEYKKMIDEKQIYDIPIEFYQVSFAYFSESRTVNFRYCPFKVSLIDTTRKDYSNELNRFVSQSIADNLTPKDIVDLTVEYRKNRNIFKSNDIVKTLNAKIQKGTNLADKQIKLDMHEVSLEQWKTDMTISVDDILFENVGFGTQNTIKIELAAKNKADETNIILMEEPENNLSYTNMSKLLSKLSSNTDKQIFVTTHSSFVANKLGFNNIFILNSGKVSKLDELDYETTNFFRKLPGYNTLRLVLAEKVILVEGPTDDLIISRSYIDKHKKLPIEDGIDIIVVDSLAFKRYCDIAALINKPVKVVIDNDGDIENNITKKFEKYENVELYYDTNEANNTIEISVLNANKDLGENAYFKEFKKAVSKNGSTVNKSYTEIKDFLLNNKVEWALRVFDYENNIKYPEHITNAIK